MHGINRRWLLKSAVVVAAAGSALRGFKVRAQAVPLKLKFGNDLPATHSVNIRLAQAIEAIASETQGQVAISLFPNNQLGSDTDMMTQLRSGALELATMPGTVLSTLISQTSLTGVGFAFTSYDRVWDAMDGEVGNFIRRQHGRRHEPSHSAVGAAVRVSRPVDRNDRHGPRHGRISRQPARPCPRRPALCAGGCDVSGVRHFGRQGATWRRWRRCCSPK